LRSFSTSILHNRVIGLINLEHLMNFNLHVV